MEWRTPVLAEYDIDSVGDIIEDYDLNEPVETNGVCSGVLPLLCGKGTTFIGYFCWNTLTGLK